MESTGTVHETGVPPDCVWLAGATTGVREKTEPEAGSVEASTAVQEMSLPTFTAKAFTVAVGHAPQSAGHVLHVSAMSH